MVVVSDPVDLVTACSVKAAKLRPISDTVAVSELAHPKVQAALERKGLVPEVVLGAPRSRPQPRRPPSAAQQRRARTRTGPQAPARPRSVGFDPDLVDTLGPEKR